MADNSPPDRTSNPWWDGIERLKNPRLSEYEAVGTRQLLKNLAIVVTVTLCLGFVSHWHVNKLVVESGEQFNAIIARTVLNALSPRVLEYLRSAPAELSDVNTPAYRMLDREVRRIIRGTRVMQLKIYSLEGSTLYSTDSSQVGENRDANPQFHSAMTEHKTSSLVFRKAFNRSERVTEEMNLLESCFLMDGEIANGTAVGVFELYTDVTSLVRKLEQSHYWAMLLVVVLLSISLGLHLQVTRTARKTISKHRKFIKAQTLALGEFHSLSNSLLDSIQAQILIVDQNGRIQRTNDFTKNRNGGDPSGSHISTLIRPCRGERPGADTLGSEMRKAFLTGLPQRGVQAEEAAAGNRLLSIDVHPIGDRHTTPGLAILYARDVTDEKAAQQQSCRQERLVAAGALAAGYAHDLRNPLASLASEIDLLAQEQRSDETLRAPLASMRRHLQRVLGIIGEMHAAFRSDHPSGQCASAAQSIRLAAAQAGCTAAVSGVSLIQDDIDPGLEMWINPNHLVMVLHNLLENAIQASSRDGRVVVGAGPAPGGKVEIRIEDRGRGMSPEEVEKALSALYTTKPHGLGLGLTVSQEIIRVAGGTLLIRSTPGKGTKVTLVLRAADAGCGGETLIPPLTADTPHGPERATGNNR